MLFFGPKKLLVGLFILLSHGAVGGPIHGSLEKRFEPCHDAPVDMGSRPTYGFPDHGGPTFCATKWDQGLVVTGIEVWSLQYQIKAIQFSFSDGSQSIIEGQKPDSPPSSKAKRVVPPGVVPPVNPVPEANNWPCFANSVCSHASIFWDQTDTISDIEIYDNQAGDALGRIKVKTAAGKVMDAGCKFWKWRVDENGDKREQHVPIQTGILIGTNGISASMINSLTWMFLPSKTTSATIIDIEYDESLDNWNQQQKGIKNQDVQRAVYKNASPTGSPDQTFSFENSQSATTSSEASDHTIWSGGMSYKLTLEATVKWPVLRQAVKVGGELEGHWDKTTDHGDTTTQSTTSQVTWKQGGTMKAGHGADCTATTQTGTFDSAYTATIQINLEGGGKYTLTKRGTFHGSGWLSAVAECKDITLDEANALTAQEGLEHCDPGLDHCPTKRV